MSFIREFISENPSLFSRILVYSQKFQFFPQLNLIINVNHVILSFCNFNTAVNFVHYHFLMLHSEHIRHSQTMQLLFCTVYVLLHNSVEKNALSQKFRLKM